MKTNNANPAFMLIFLCSLMTLAACTTTQPTLPAITVEEQSTPILPAEYDAIDYYSWVIGAEPEQMQQEQIRLQRLDVAAGEHEALVQLAVLISAKTSDPEQEQRALDLLDQFEQYQSAGIRSDYRALAHLWRQALEPRRQSHELRQQIKALTTIEQQLNRREQQGG